MPANLTPQYFEAEEKFKAATTLEEKVAALEEMLRVIPKHKGTEKMQADLKRRLSKLRKQSQKKGPTTTHRPYYHVDREGAGQVVLAGPANSGKSTLLEALTNAEPEVANYPFTTRAPLAGMMDFEDIQIQLVDMPPLAPETFEAWQTAMIAQSDITLLIFDVNDPLLLDQTDYVLQKLKERRISPRAGRKKPRILVFGNKVDLPEGEENLAVWKDLYQNKLEVRPLCAHNSADLQCLQRKIFELLEIVRVYTKRPGHSLEKSAPYTLKKGSTVLEAAAAVHQDFARNFKYARIWGAGCYDGQMVERTHVIEDGDIIEIHA